MELEEARDTEERDSGICPGTSELRVSVKLVISWAAEESELPQLN